MGSCAAHQCQGWVDGGESGGPRRRLQVFKHSPSRLQGLKVRDSREIGGGNLPELGGMGASSQKARFLSISSSSETCKEVKLYSNHTES